MSEEREELRNCDIVMKGGITSGVVYPSAVFELSRAFRFRNIGGTSAGAIAAAATAAAEYARRNGKEEGFQRLAELPKELAETLPGGSSRLFSLFQPSAETKALFDLFVAGIERGERKTKAVRVLCRILAGFPVGALTGALAVALVPAACLVYALLYPLLYPLVGAAPAPVRLVLGLALFWVLAVAAVAAVAGSAVEMMAHAARAIPENGYGLCRGYDESRDGTHPDSGPPPLTEWLAGYLNDLAGKARTEGPLTFGDLEGGDADRSIRLRMMTSCVTLGRPFQMPFENVFFFRESQLRGYFPGWVIDWMIQHPNSNFKEKDGVDLLLGNEKLHPLPGPADLPVVVAARMSLSFPLLISAVPLYAVDWGAQRKKGTGGALEAGPPLPEPCWFSDGGLSSNLPIHFFDAPLPRWPTVAINLNERPEVRDDDEENVWLAKDNRGGVLDSWTRFDDLLGFVSSLVNVMQNWRDQTLSKMPGFRDRIAHIALGPGEGGLNLVMGEEALRRLKDRGCWAGVKLRRRFAEPRRPGELSWENQRWVRYRSVMAAFEEVLLELRAVYRQQTPGEPSYPDLIQSPPSYSLKSQELQKQFLEMTERLMKLADDLQAHPTFRKADPPHPRGDMRVVPPV